MKSFKHREKILLNMPRSHHKRRCFVEAVCKPFERHIYHPNFYVDQESGIDFTQVKPSEGTRYNKHIGWLAEHVETFNAKANAVGLIYFKLPEDLLTASTYFILSHNNKRIGVTALHAIYGKGATKDTAEVEAYITPKACYRYLDMFHQFQNNVMYNVKMAPHTWKRVTIRKDILEIRRNYIQSVAQAGHNASLSSSTSHSPVPSSSLARSAVSSFETENLPPIVLENLDPAFHLQPDITLDALFFDIPDDALALFEPTQYIRIASVLPETDSPVVLLALHSVLPETTKELKKEYAATTDYPPQPEDYIWPNLSASLCLMKEKGQGIACLEGSTAEQSSGGPFLDSNGDVFAINNSNFYDSPNTQSQFPPYTIRNHDDLIYADVILPESPAASVLATRNRLNGVQVTHSGFQQMLAAI